MNGLVRPPPPLLLPLPPLPSPIFLVLLIIFLPALQAMVDGISNSAVFLLVSSQEYEESMNCMREMNYADRTKKPIIHVCTGGFDG